MFGVAAAPGAVVVVVATAGLSANSEPVNGSFTAAALKSTWLLVGGAVGADGVGAGPGFPGGDVGGGTGATVVVVVVVVGGGGGGGGGVKHVAASVKKAGNASAALSDPSAAPFNRTSSVGRHRDRVRRTDRA